MHSMGMLQVNESHTSYIDKVFFYYHMFPQAATGMPTSEEY
jgi:hypothetical protein